MRGKICEEEKLMKKIKEMAIKISTLKVITNLLPNIPYMLLLKLCFLLKSIRHLP
jgi:hypothetical protein